MTVAYQLNNIKYSYDKALALSLDELTIKANKVTALIGPNGCGKSTLLNLLAFLAKNQQGDIHFFSELLTNQCSDKFIKGIALLPQKPYMLRGTVVENLTLALKMHNKKSDHLTQIKQVLDELNIVHLGQQQAKMLSGGELQKVALARAIITNPEVLLMDEPFSYLDHSSEQWLEQFIHSYVKKYNKTLIFSTHNRLQGIAIADDIISLVDGKMVKTPLINLYHGMVKNTLFDTGKVQIMLADKQQSYQHVSIDPNEIVLSRELIKSSMRNQFKGKVTGIVDEMGKIRVTISAGEIFQVLITEQALKELDISLADQLWVNFKSNSILAF